MASTLHSLLKQRGLKVFTDAATFFRALRQRVPFAAARRRAQYVIIDYHRIPLGFDAQTILRLHLDRITRVHDGLGYTAERALSKKGAARAGLHPLPPGHPSPSFARTPASASARRSDHRASPGFREA